ncbi:hypothetical protein BAUCODRAFT_33436 [Baudoinia panamericana UAMH 10762]|uniref:Uncharacterized protein n=1 Tax=Baudoinia panamericana (strain UAMH 10762) TaxID=717646 RepID=M2NFE8_BAUPA|nr:uncharacterized protein BAUCODRAFT_33436 [Baudoinia panamericana UAMH 10762]EMC97715.1 hypothetical protein BAUCODRAFT_33436 [Baudoinia panamericana UAMH 10762]
MVTGLSTEYKYPKPTNRRKASEPGMGRGSDLQECAVSQRWLLTYRRLASQNRNLSHSIQAGNQLEATYKDREIANADV